VQRLGGFAVIPAILKDFVVLKLLNKVKEDKNYLI
jgi:hypothetical protein